MRNCHNRCQILHPPEKAFVVLRSHSPGLDLGDECEADIASSPSSPAVLLPLTGFLLFPHGLPRPWKPPHTLHDVFILCPLEMKGSPFPKDVYVSAGSVQKDGCLGKAVIREKAFADNCCGMT